MLSRLAADAVLLVHLASIVFVIAGGLFARSRRRLRRVHVGTVAYSVLIQLLGFTCPLTPLEKHLREQAGSQGYDGGFVEHYVVSIIYPGGLDWIARTVLVAGLAALFAGSYWPLLRDRGDQLTRRRAARAEAVTATGS